MSPGTSSGTDSGTPSGTPVPRWVALLVLLAPLLLVGRAGAVPVSLTFPTIVDYVSDNPVVDYGFEVGDVTEFSVRFDTDMLGPCADSAYCATRPPEPNVYFWGDAPFVFIIGVYDGASADSVTFYDDDGDGNGSYLDVVDPTGTAFSDLDYSDVASIFLDTDWSLFTEGWWSYDSEPGDDVSGRVIPEPSSMTLLALGLGLLAGRRRARARAGSGSAQARLREARA